MAGPHVLLLNADAQRCIGVGDRLRARGVLSTCVDMPGTELPSLPRADVAMLVLDQEQARQQLERVSPCIERLSEQKIATLVWGAPRGVPMPTGAFVEHVAADASLDEVMGRLATLSRYAPIVRRMEVELRGLERLARQLNKHFDEIDQELRLAGRLQREFLPQNLPQAAPIKLASIFRPATFVSGDIFDAFEIDSRNLGLFVADAMGHGTAAGLLTMFLRNGLVPRRVVDGRQETVPPGEAMATLHHSLLRQSLPHSQFVTAIYAVLDCDALTLRLARAGHPYPVHIRRDGTIRELHATGGLLGIPDLDPEFEEVPHPLEPGDKVLFYTDGIESLFVASRSPDGRQVEFASTLERWSVLGVDDIVQAICTHLDHAEGSLNPADDVTLLALEVQG